MRLLTRLIVGAAVAMLLSAAGFQVVDLWFGDKSSAVEAFRHLVQERRRTESLLAHLDKVKRSLEIKRDVTAQLISGRVSFLQAIADFQRANELVENGDLDRIPGYRTPTDPQEAGRQVLLWARNRVATWPADKAKRLLSDFESEYQKIFAGAKRDGTAGA
jgi:hypothetical protein